MNSTLGDADFLGAVPPPLSAAEAEPFWLCLLFAVCLGMVLVMLDNTERKDGGSNPISHLSDCKDTTDALFADLLSEGVGLGLLEPMWRLCTPEGALWTLMTGWSPRDKAGSLGLGGLASAAGSVLAAAGGLLKTAARALGRAAGTAKKGGTAHDKIKMSFLTEVHAYWGYLRLFVMGVFREYIVRLRAAVWRDEASRKFVARERWSSGWVEFYLQHMYKLYVDCFNRPIASAPDATVDVIKRVRSGGALFGPLHDFECTGEVQKCVNLASYNYLGFGGVDEFCTPVARATALEHGFSAAASRTEGGTLPIHRELEAEVARFLGKEDAMVLGMGFATNSTILPSLFEAKAGGRGILVLSDELNHRSIVEGVRLSGATVRAFAHNSMPALEAELCRALEVGQPGGEPWRKVFVVVEGIYSMEGDFCRLREIVTLKNRYGAYLYLDEAHSIGAVGPTGRGVTELLGVPTDEVDVMMGTFTKSFGSAGGYVAASRDVISALRRNAPGSMFASAMSPPCAAQALVALRVISGAEGGDVGSTKLARIKDNANFFRSRLEEEGFKVLGDADSPIIPVMLHHGAKLAAVSRMCLARGVAVVVVGYPAVPILYERVRFCISASHTREQLASVITAFTEIGEKLGLLFERTAGHKEKLSARLARSAEHAGWLRSAPMERRGSATRAPVASTWAPELLAPACPQSGLAAAALAAATRAEKSAGLDLRLFDPLGYTSRPSPAAQEAIVATMNTYGFGACGPRGFYGTTKPHLELESALAKFLSVDSAIVYSAGVATASSILPALIQQGDRAIVDAEVHLGIRTGLRLCKAEVCWVKHGDVTAIESAISVGSSAKQSERGKPQRRTFIIAEAVCQRTGQLAALPELVALKERYGALLILDETLSIGTLGAHGRGLCEMNGIHPSRVDAIVGSLEHAFANVGGFCAGRRSLVEHQRLAGAGYCFSASCPPSACSGATAVLTDLLGEGGKARLSSMRTNTALLHRTLQTALEHAPVKLVSSPESYVQHLRLTVQTDAAEEHLMAAAEHCATQSRVHVQLCSSSLCLAEGAFGARLGAPPASTPSIRVCASSELSADDIAAVGAALQTAFCSPTAQ